MEIIDHVNSPVERNLGGQRVRPPVERVPVDTGEDHIEANIGHLYVRAPLPDIRSQVHLGYRLCALTQS